MKKGIDVAKWNGTIDWKKVKASGTQFAVLKVINKQGRTEESFEKNYAGTMAQRIPVDVYNYSYATSIQKATQDANAVLAHIKGKNVGYVWMDVEDKIQMGLAMTLIDMINAYQSIIERAGYKFGVYTGLYFYNTYIKPYRSSVHCPFWIARYPSGAVMDMTMEPRKDKKPVISPHELLGWQYTSSGRVDGIQGNVDLNIRY